MNKFPLLCAAILVLAASSCKKEESAPTRYELLTAGKWRQIAHMSYETAGSTTDTTDEYAGTSDCAKDDLSIFRTDSHLISDEGPTKCSVTAPQQSDEGVWTLTNQDNSLHIASTLGIDLDFKINTLTSSSLEIEVSDTASGVITRQVATFTHVD